MRRWLVLLFLIACLTIALTVADSQAPRSSRTACSSEFQRMTGGLGMGASSAIYYDFSTFDPRLESDCACSLWPVPGGHLFSPEHRLTVWDPPEILGDARRINTPTPGGTN